MLYKHKWEEVLSLSLVEEYKSLGVVAGDLVTLVRTEGSYKQVGSTVILGRRRSVGLIAMYARLKRRSPVQIFCPIYLFNSVAGFYDWFHSDHVKFGWSSRVIVCGFLYSFAFIVWRSTDNDRIFCSGQTRMSTQYHHHRYDNLYCDLSRHICDHHHISTQGTINSFLLFINPDGLLLSGLCMGTALVFAEKTKRTIVSISDGAFAGTALSVVASIILFFIAVGVPETIRSVLLVGCYGLFYGVLIHIGSYFVALENQRSPPVKLWNKEFIWSTTVLFIFFRTTNIVETFTSWNRASCQQSPDPDQIISGSIEKDLPYPPERLRLGNVQRRLVALGWLHIQTQPQLFEQFRLLWRIIRCFSFPTFYHSILERLTRVLSSATKQTHLQVQVSPSLQTPVRWQSP